MAKELTAEEKARLARNEYNRKWSKTHKDKRKEYELSYWRKVYDRTHCEAGDNDAE